MPTQNSPKRLEEQLLGEIKTQIVEVQSHGATVAPGEQVNLEREPGNSGNPCSIRVENGRFQSIGYLPLQVATWMTPLVDSGQIRVEGYVPLDLAPFPEGGGQPACHLDRVSQRERQVAIIQPPPSKQRRA